jgi:hypothetical protein
VITTQNRPKRTTQSRRHAAHRHRVPSRFGVEFLEQRLLLAVDWDGDGDGASWSDAMNWSADQVPAATDDVRIATGAAGQFTLRLDAPNGSMHCA